MINKPTQLAVGSVETQPGTRIFYRVWETHNHRSRPAVLVIHGIGFHSGPYEIVAAHLSGSGYLVAAMDLRGHGKSGGPRGEVPVLDQLLIDVDAVIRLIRSEHAPTRLYLLGESMGGLVAINYAARRPTAVDGLILVAPAVGVACPQLLKADNIRILPALLFERTRPVIDLAGPRLEDASVDEDFIRARRADPLAINRISVDYLLGLNRLQTGLADKAAAIHAPTLVLHGKRDTILSWQASAWFQRRLGSADKQFVTFEDARHTLFWDPSTPEVFEVIRGWLKSRSDSG